MADIFNTEMLPQYKQRSAEVVTESAKLSLDELMRSEYEAKEKRAEVILQKYQVLSGEYQNQAK